MARRIADEELQHIGKEILLADTKKKALEGEISCKSVEDYPIYRSTVAHAEQQTDESTLQQAEENAALKKQVTILTGGVKMIKDNDERTS